MRPNSSDETASSPGAKVWSQGLAPLAPDRRPIRGWADTVGELSAGSAGSTTAPPFAALRLVYLRRIVGTAFGAAGIERATHWGSWIARNLFDLNPPARKRVEASLLAAYGHTLSAARQEQLARAVFDSIARFWVEALFARRLLRPDSWTRFVRVADRETWQRLAGDRRPAILVTGYFGNVAVGAYVLGRIFRPVHVLIDRVELPVLRPWQDALYADRNVRLIAREEAVRELPRILDAGGKVMILGEHARRTGRAFEVPFLGRVRRCYPTIGILAARHNARVVIFSTRRLSPPAPAFRFEVRCHEVIDPGGPVGALADEAAPSEGRTSRPSGVRDPRPPVADPARAVVERCVGALERLIRESPEQYDWSRAHGAPGYSS
jgi:lauroyl/myristoyl acyltransferase